MEMVYFKGGPLVASSVLKVNYTVRTPDKGDTSASYLACANTLGRTSIEFYGISRPL